ncbi:MAG: class II aldolase/adducin family protein [Solobacterium sp.]|nr:class II aldolase/adducin family protein [Solobacterium sp.]
MKQLLTIKRELALAAHRAYQRGLQVGNGGNLSARVLGKEEMIIKPSGGSFMDCDENSWMRTDLEGNVLEGDGKPSGEALLHRTIYKCNPSANAIVHCHSTYANTVALFHDEIPTYNYHSIFKLGGFIEVLNINKPGVTPSETHLVEEIFERQPNVKAFILGRHGLVAVGKDPLEAEHNAELVEETAMVAYLTEMYGKQMGETKEPIGHDWYAEYLASKK